MKNIIIVFKALIALVLININWGCISYFEPMKTSPATLGPITQANDELTSLPAPKEKVVAAVYKFRDQTGQYKESSSGAQQ